MKKLLIILCVAVMVIAAGVTAYVLIGNALIKKSVNHFTVHSPVTIESYTKGSTVKAQYLAASGMEDDAVQAKLNELLYDFCVGQFASLDDADPTVYNGIVESANHVGDLLSVTRIMTSSGPGRAAFDQRSEYSAMTLQLTDGEYFTFPLTAAQLKQAVSEGKFTQVQPLDPIEGALEQLAASLNEEHIPPYYLTETGVGLYINNVGALENEYAVFAAPYENLPAFEIPGKQYQAP